MTSTPMLRRFWPPIRPRILPRQRTRSSGWRGRRLCLRGAQDRAAHRADAHAGVSVFLRIRSRSRRARPRRARTGAEFRVRKQLRTAAVRQLCAQRCRSGALASDERLLDAVCGHWHPNADDSAIVHWPAFKHPSGQGHGTEKYLALDGSIAQRLQYGGARCDFWQPFVFRSVTGSVPASAR